MSPSSGFINKPRRKKTKYVERMLVALSESGNCSWIHNLQLPESFHTFFASKWESGSSCASVFVLQRVPNISRESTDTKSSDSSTSAPCTWVFKCFRVRYLRWSPLSCFYRSSPGLSGASNNIEDCFPFTLPKPLLSPLRGGMLRRRTLLSETIG